jgi:chemotaxis protein methyltransferase CheR
MTFDSALAVYEILSDLLEAHTGQTLPANRHTRVEMALKPLLRQNSIPDMVSLGVLLSQKTDETLARQCVEAMINNETCFFRDQANFALLTGPVLDNIRAHRMTSKRIRIWSSACSTGQEAYSLAMALAENAEKWSGWTVQILATDVSQSAVAQARSGRYSQFEIQRGMPVMMMLKHFTQEGEEWVAKSDLQQKIRFGEHNLLKPAMHFGQFDVILCRNVLMYLSEINRKRVFDQLSASLATDGILVLGAAETVIGQSEKFNASQEFRGFYEAVGRTNSRPNYSQLLARTA